MRCLSQISISDQWREDAGLSTNLWLRRLELKKAGTRDSTELVSYKMQVLGTREFNMQR
jgi:hypothetical protein